ncbi:MAG: prepilin-type N-terminal cleavage/methylation domain-containing protein [Planctomycetaceae bacterium]
MRRLSIHNRQCVVRRSGYTLIEILVVISIVLILASITLATVKFSRDADRVRNGALQVQSFLAGARDRAIYSKEPRGVRLFIEPPPGGVAAGPSPVSRTISTMAYIAPGGTWGSPENSSGINLERTAPGADVTLVHGFNNPGWWNLKRRGWLVDGLRIRIPKGPTGNWYPIDTSLIDTTVAPADDQLLILQIPYADPGDPTDTIAHRDLTYEIELPARILPQDPAILPEGTVIDLDGSKVPDIWRPANTGNGNYSGYMDIVFSPRGNVIGDAAAAGVLHFYVCDSEDSLFLKEQYVNGIAASRAVAPLVALNAFDSAVAAGLPFIPMDEIDPNLASGGTAWLGLSDTHIVKDRRMVSVFTQTGGISINQINSYVGFGGGAPDLNDPVDIDNDGNFAEPDGLADDPYRFAETGDVAP